MTDKQIVKKLAERYKEMCKSPFADGYTFKAFEGRCAEHGFTIDDVRNYIEKEKQERKTKQAESRKSLKEQLKLKEQECEELKRVKDDFFKHAEISHEAVLNKNKIIDEQEKQLDQLKAENIKIYKTLTEIKEIAGEDFNHTCWKTYAGQLEQILQKISECEV